MKNLQWLEKGKERYIIWMMKNLGLEEEEEVEEVEEEEDDEENI